MNTTKGFSTFALKLFFTLALLLCLGVMQTSVFAVEPTTFNASNVDDDTNAGNEENGPEDNDPGTDRDPADEEDSSAVDSTAVDSTAGDGSDGDDEASTEEEDTGDDQTSVSDSDREDTENSEDAEDTSTEEETNTDKTGTDQADSTDDVNETDTTQEEINQGDLEEEPGIPDGPITVDTYAALTEAVKNAGVNPTTITITQTFALTGYLEVKQDQDITLIASEGAALERSEAAKGSLWVNGALTLENIILDGKNVPSPYALVFITSAGMVTMNDGAVIQNAYNDYSEGQYGGGVYNAGRLVMNGGAISGNKANSYGGGVYNVGEFTMKGGEISGNKNPTWYGGGVYNGNRFTMEGGTIANNEATGTSWGYGGGVYNSASFTVTGGTFSGNAAKKFGGGVYSNTGVNMADTVFSGNVGGAVYVSADAVFDSATYTLSNLTITGTTGNVSALYVCALSSWDISDCTFTENNLSGGNVVEIKSLGYAAAESSLRVLKNCVISNNTASRGAALSMSCSYGETKVIGCEITDNEGTYGGIYNGSNSNTTIGEGTLVARNIGTTTGGLHNQTPSNAEGKLLIDGAVIKENKGKTTGGIFANGGPIEFASGALYQNTGDAANDFRVTNVKTVYSLIMASEMLDPDADPALFTKGEYIWAGSTLGTEDQAFVNATGQVNLTAMTNVTRYVAEIGEAKYETLEEAVEAAQDGDTIQFVLGVGNDAIFGNKFAVSKPITIDKAVTIVLHDQLILANGEEVFHVNENGSLTLRGTAMVDGQITVDGGALAMDGGIVPYAYDGGRVTAKDFIINVNSGSFTIHGTVPYVAYAHSLQVNLAKGMCITAGEGFSIEKNIQIKLDDEIYNSFNNANNGESLDDIVLIEGCTDADTLSKIVFKTPFSNALVQIKADNGKIALRKFVLEGGVYLDGQNGSDNNDGKTSDTPVKTFDYAKMLANERGEKIIYVVGQITASGELDGKLESGENVTLFRYPAYKGHLISASNLTLMNITLDGAVVDFGVKDGKSLLYVSGGTVTLGEGVVLQNNDVSANTNYPWHHGGGVYVGSGTTLIMNDGAMIRDCTARFGGGVLANGKFILNGGTIRDCKAVRAGSDVSGYGGGVAIITNNGSMTMYGGDILENEAERSGGGIALPLAYPTRKEGSKLWIYGGNIEGNFAPVTGGGIFVQCGNTATIGSEEQSTTKVYIKNNTAHGDTRRFAGGGIYVNGGKGGYENGLLQLYRVVIQENDAAENGGGLAGCLTSKTHIYLKNGGAFFGNTSSKGKDDVTTLPIGPDGSQVIGSNPEVEISPIMLGGGAYNWTGVGTSLGIPLNMLTGNQSVSLYSNSMESAQAAAIAMANVFIELNHGGYNGVNNGGGIGSNGDVIIGSAPTSDPTSISVEKKWKDEGYEAQRPTYVDVKVLRSVQGGETEVYGTLRVYEDDGWEAALNNLPSKDSEGNTYTYSIQEVAGFYFAEVTEGNGQNAFIITNTPAGKLTVTKQVAGLSGNDSYRDKEFSFTVTSKVEGFTPVTFTLKDGETYTLEGLLPGEYTIKEDTEDAQIDGYELTAEGVVNVIIAALEDSEITIHNAYDSPEYTSVTVNKVWVGDNENNRPDNVAVQLYRDDIAYGSSVTLNAANNWSYVWNQLDALYKWAVGELNVPDGYTSTVSQDGTVFTITNTYTPDKPSDNPPKDPPTDIPDPDVPLVPGPEPEEPPVDIEEPDVPLAPGPEPEEPPVIIEEPDVPLVDLPPVVDVPDVDVPLVSAPPVTTIPDTEVPLADVPQTGDMSGVWFALTALAACGLAVLNLRRKDAQA